MEGLGVFIYVVLCCGYGMHRMMVEELRHPEYREWELNIVGLFCIVFAPIIVINELRKKMKQ